MRSTSKTSGKMGRISRSLILVGVCLANSTTAHSLHAIFERAGTCGDSTYSSCGNAGLPSNFCCPSTSTCIPLAANTTMLCCGKDSNCAAIIPITCDISKQNTTLNPASTLVTTALTSTLLTCGSGCCPFGYSCNTLGQCMMNADQQASPPPKPSSSTVSSSPTASNTHSPSSTGPATASIIPITTTNDTTPYSANSCDKFPATAVIVGFFPGLITGILLTVASICLFGRSRQKPDRRHSGSSFGNISEPQPSGIDMRTDFLRKQPMTPSTNAPSTPRRQNTITRVRSMFRKSTSTNGGSIRYERGSPRASPVPPIPLNVQRPMMQLAQERPVTPHMQREPSYEDINIFTDGNTASSLRERERLGVKDQRASGQTTFTDMMERSGLASLQKGQPYIYKGTSTLPPPRQESPRRS